MKIHTPEPWWRKFVHAGTAAVLLAVIVASQAAPPLSGAIFTTTVDGAIVNENVHYEAKEDVYLDGGPGPNAPASAAGLPAGDYYFQVTDPSGKDLLSSDHISCRKIHVNENGVIDYIYNGTNYTWQNGQNASWVAEGCRHNQGVDLDHPELGAITVQLYPYDDTPNPGGVYKVWITPVADYAPLVNFDPGLNNKKDPVNNESWEGGNAHGFIPAKSKTDNYKVKKKGKPFNPPVIDVLKFHDSNANGVHDEGEEWVTGWRVDYAEPIGTSGHDFTPFTLLAAEAGDYLFTEDTPAGSLQTVSILDGIALSNYPAANPLVVVVVAGESDETHTVVYGNVGIGQVDACKTFDINANGQNDNEPGIAGWMIRLTGTNVLGEIIDITQTTGADGCTSFANLLPGSYTVTEIMPADGVWTATSDLSSDVTIESALIGASITGNTESASFTNICHATADFDTKGYWHNKNGVSELTEADRLLVNSLLPYSSPSAYFDDGDEPFDGSFTNGDPVEPTFGNEGEIAPAGSWQAEVSQFLVDQNASASLNYHREQLAQQLLAFIFNSYHRLGGPAASLQLPDGTYATAQSLIDEAIALWASGTDAERDAMKTLLDGFNNNDAVNYIPASPCAVNY